MFFVRPSWEALDATKRMNRSKAVAWTGQLYAVGAPLGASLCSGAAVYLFIFLIALKRYPVDRRAACRAERYRLDRPAILFSEDQQIV